MLSKKLDFRKAFKMFEESVNASIETALKLGVYIMLFSVIISIIQHFPVKGIISELITSPLEISNGLYIIKQSRLPYLTDLSAIMLLDAFGGICIIMQTRCVCTHYISIKIHIPENNSMYCDTDNIASGICIKTIMIDYSASV